MRSHDVVYIFIRMNRMITIDKLIIQIITMNESYSLWLQSGTIYGLCLLWSQCELSIKYLPARTIFYCWQVQVESQVLRWWQCEHWTLQLYWEETPMPGWSCADCSPSCLNDSQWVKRRINHSRTEHDEKILNYLKCWHMTKANQFWVVLFF